MESRPITLAEKPGSDWKDQLCYSSSEKLTCPGLKLPNLLAAAKPVPVATPRGGRPAVGALLPVTKASPPPPPWFTVKSSPSPPPKPPRSPASPSPPPPPPKPPKPSPPPPPMPCDWTIGRERLCAKEWDRPECADGVPVWCFKYNADEAACNNAYAKRVTGKYGWCFYEAGACKLVGDFDCPNLDLDATTTAPAPITTIAPATTTRFEIYLSPPPPPMPTPTPWWLMTAAARDGARPSRQPRRRPRRRRP